MENVNVIDDAKSFNRSFFQRDTIIVAQELLGSVIIHKKDNDVLAGRIVETEAYGHTNDPASHAFRGETNRNQAMFGCAGHAYIYFIYGNHFCFNIVAKDSFMPAGAVLIRAIEPLAGIDIMVKLRNKDGCQIGNGPGKLTQALGIHKMYDYKDLLMQDTLYLKQGTLAKKNEVCQTTRIGIRVGNALPWRFYIKNNPYVSKK